MCTCIVSYTCTYTHIIHSLGTCRSIVYQYTCTCTHVHTFTRSHVHSHKFLVWCASGMNSLNMLHHWFLISKSRDSWGYTPVMWTDVLISKFCTQLYSGSACVDIIINVFTPVLWRSDCDGGDTSTCYNIQSLFTHK